MPLSLSTKKVFIVGAKRTPFGAFGGSFKSLTATDLAVISSKSAIESCKIDPSNIDATFIGNVIQSSNDACYMSRHVGLRSGVPISSPSLTINRLCGSGFETLVQGTEAILLGSASVTLCGGSENMSACPMILNGSSARWGVTLGSSLKLEDSLWAGLTDSYVGLPMGITAENLAAKYDINRKQCDEFALRSQLLWAAGHASGSFNAEIAPITIELKKGPKTIDTDEHPRPETTIEKLGNLKSVFKKDGVVTAGNSSGICDGAGSLVVASGEAIKSLGLDSLAKVVSWGIVGCEPSIMGIGPVNAIKKALKFAELKLEDIDLIEVNEAFAAQYLAVEKELNLNRDIVNTCGGAIALGHPLGASGSRILAHLTHKLIKEKLRYGVGAACIGGGQGIAVILENTQL
mmetsp:Transcript_15862/g.22355  ORF Transcript_15862/g.22355 Transcript_15862/m.22355 type:complete len:404 (+) Transcript_15862:57-1268(+)